MKDNVKDFLKDFDETLKSIDYVKPEEIPNIDLYMDQITTFMDEQFAACKRREEDKILTKTMINNYAKNNLLPPPEKKKYSKEHVLTMIFIYYYKNILSINDIQSILNPLTEKYFGNKDGLNMEAIYKEVFTLERAEAQQLLKNLGKKYMLAHDTFTDVPEEERKFLQTFCFICLLSFDVYLKKMMIEKVIDELNEEKETQSE